MDRRDFIKLTAVTGTSATLASCGNPEHQLIRFIPDDDLVPGVAEWKPSVCPLCAAGCGLTVRVMEADAEVVRNGEQGMLKIAAAKKLEGQPDHPINHGGLCPRGQAAIQVTYHPDRVTQPMKRRGARGAGEFEPVTWDAAIAELVSQLDQAAAEPAAIACLARPRRSRRLELTAQVLRGCGAPPPMTFEVFGDAVLRRANAISFGREQLPTYDLARSRYVISFGADFLGTWNSPVAQNHGYGEMRQGHPQQRGTFVQVEPRMTTTGASADEWVPVKPGTEGALALGLAHVILANKLRPAGGAPGGTIAGWSEGLTAYAPEQVEKITGVPARRIDRLARHLVEYSPAVAIVGGAPLAHTNGLSTALAVNALNALLGSVNQPGGLSFMPQPSSIGPQPLAISHQPSAMSGEMVARLTATVLLLDDVNPVYGAPKAWRVRETLEKIPFIASFGSFIDETSSLADLILPDHSFLESWSDSLPESGASVAVANVAGPVMRPLHQTRAMPDVLIEVAGKLKKPVSLPWKTYDEMLKASMPEAAWTAAQTKGWTELTQSSVGSRQSSVDSRQSSVEGRQSSVTYEEPRFEGDAATYPFHFLPYASQSFYDGSLAHLPWLQELPDPMTSAMWSSWVEINPSTAERLGIRLRDLVEVTSPQGTLRAPAILSPGIAPDVVAMPVGQGHETFTRYASGRGANPLGILAPVTEPQTGALAWAATRVKIARAGDPDGSLIMFAGEMREHPHEHETR
jgi:anaerobic selenocysteine-containing dehydrogenase